MEVLYSDTARLANDHFWYPVPAQIDRHVQHERYDQGRRSENFRAAAWRKRYANTRNFTSWARREGLERIARPDGSTRPSAGTCDNAVDGS